MPLHPIRLALFSTALAAGVAPVSAQFLTVGTSPRTLGSNRENFETEAYRVGSFGWLSLTMSERHPEYRYPTPADLNPAGWFSSLPHDVARGDFNGDGREDLVATVATFPHTVPRQTRFTFAVLLNDGLGGFRYATDIWAASIAPTRRYIVTRVVTADFNRDGRADFAGAPEGLNMRNADGSFTLEREAIPLVLSGADGKLHDATANIAGQENGGRVAGLDFSHDLSAGDINGDGAPDIFTAGALLINDGTGRFTAFTSLPNELKPGSYYLMSSEIGDLNADGIGDLVVTYSENAPGNASGWIWLSQNGSSSLTGRRLVALPAGRYGAGQTKFNHTVIVDVTGDGRNDIVFGVTRAVPYYEGRTLQVLVNQSGDTFTDETNTRVVAPPDLDKVWGQGQLQVGDVNRDGLPDIVHTGPMINDDTSPPSTTVYLGGSDGVLRAMDRSAQPWIQPWQLAGYEGTRSTTRRAQSMALLADIDGRGHLDFIATVSTPFLQWPQVEPSQVSFYSIVGKTADPARPASTLSNLSVRTGAGAGDRTLIVGFVVGGGGRDILMRAIGPTLGEFGVPGTLADPKLELYTGTARSATNDNWAASGILAANFSAVGAFPLAATSRDSALRLSLAGSRSIQVTSAATGSGIALVELYDAGGGSGRLVNVSARAEVGTGADILAVGFAIAGTAPKRLLLRAVGPTLGGFGVGGTLADPVLTVRRQGEETPLAANDDWAGSDTLITAFNSVAAFQFSAANSRDAALVVNLPPGTYTATVAGKNETTGVALVEVYELP